MACNKVITKDGRTLLDLTEDDVTQGDVLQGKKFHGRDGVSKTGSYVPLDTSDATATAGDILSGETAYVNGQKITGTLNVEDSAAAAWNEYKTHYPNEWAYSFAGEVLINSSNKNTINKYLSDAFFSSIDFTLPNSNNMMNYTGMFRGCRHLVHAPRLIMSKINQTSLMYLFQNCTNLIDISATDWSSLRLATTANAGLNFASMFEGCSNLASLPNDFDISGGAVFSRMFANCTSLTSLPPSFATSFIVNNADLRSMFIGCTSLTSIPAIDCSNLVRYGLDNIFNNCTSLTSILMINIKSNLNVETTALGHDALVTLISNLFDMTTLTETRALTMGADKLALLSSAEIQVATNKGWTLA